MSWLKLLHRDGFRTRSSMILQGSIKEWIPACFSDLTLIFFRG
jgi:hypothetical protein